MKDLLSQAGRPAIDNRHMLKAKLWMVRSLVERKTESYVSNI